MKRITILLSTFLAAAGLGAATVELSLVRTTMDPAAWNAITANTAAYEATINGYSESTGYTAVFSVEEDRLVWAFDFADGVDYNFYWSWHELWLAEVNAALAGSGLQYEVTFNGEVEVESTPWSRTDWVNAVAAYEDWLVAEGLGWIYTPDWSETNGDPSAGVHGFYGYATQVSALGWFWATAGWYYSLESQVWFRNYPGTAWFWDAEHGWRFLG
jgi:hypothetical protein